MTGVRCFLVELRNRRTTDDRYLGEMDFSALPAPGDIVLLPDESGENDEKFTVERIEHMPVRALHADYSDGMRPKMTIYIQWHDPYGRFLKS